ncbi:MAG: EsaB/YukD family protein [Synergistaceae bacterium]|nr:EsaB/YukD family protein [Synergistaceae bacterium]MBQ3398770.1 EsaB/YukD family protein [Synergistaceae bacterium]MBR0034171.1 EsaB/YukD family protein [Synergistaceae bacterium]
MNEPDTFIATITNNERSIEMDMELPSRMPISELCHQLLMILKEFHEDMFTGWEKCCIEFNSRILKNDDTLLKAGAFDGSRLTVLEGQP